ncbi:hypothetical protein [uncultured Thermomonospora sp.]|uniref:hypothetical protein n=1 Tax=uncultured Thermomonospora sp. TaxID=671175 RepID=UPI00259B9588|nr:hypothetical protein [uncultured Thermomonospora sp.]
MRRRVAVGRNSVITLTTGRAAHLMRHKRADWTPALALDFGATWVVIRPCAADQVTAHDVTFARQLARAADAFADEVAWRYALSAHSCGGPLDHDAA